jgi:hypothetical protein
VEDIKLPGNAEIPHDTNFTVLTITSPKAEAEEKGEGEEVAEAANRLVKHSKTGLGRR